ncbi:ABC transporter permease [Pseudoalteromonas shioyasakiensis]|uniref:ABC transporter permease n=1 Tax=Pseudoalteromonas shioyasakiensis TaxID=1190813 RepID=UPI0021196915|nr:ABC transporter permease [Pseudoalteromonas shioyasakiensis]MCQ8879749.1 ABC transporter permease [Pseudoalteromonas shioyasakiensis]
MFFSYLITALRSFKQQKQHFILNIVGLSLGLAAAILVTLFARYELSFDTNHPDAANVYRLHLDLSAIGYEIIPVTSVEIAQQLASHKDIEDMFILSDVIDLELATDQIQVEDNKLNLRNFYAATSNIEQFLAIKTRFGNLQAALSTPNKIALSVSEAKRLFGQDNVVGEVFSNGENNITVAAVFEDLPDNSHFLFDSLMPLDLSSPDRHSSYIYIKINPFSDIKALEELFASTMISHYSLKNSQLKYRLVAMPDIYFFADSSFDFKSGGSQFLVNISIALSILLLLIAAANFTNLSVAQLLHRTKEIAIRKTLGASKLQLVTQFLVESLLLISLSMLIALCMVELLIPIFNELSNRPFTLNFDIELIMLLVSVLLGLTLVASVYPAYLIANAPLLKVLKGELKNGRSATFIRKSLLTFQAAIAVSLIAGTLLSLNQLTLLKNIKSGYQPEGRIVVHSLDSDTMMTKEHIVVDKIRQLPDVNEVTTVDSDITDSFGEEYHFTWPNGHTEEGLMPTVGSGFSVVETLGLTLLAGRDFSAEYQTDWLHSVGDSDLQAMALIVTEKMVKRAGYQNPEDVIGMLVTSEDNNITATIVGVVADVKVGSAKEVWVPISFSCGWSAQTTVDLVIHSKLNNITSVHNEVNHLIQLFDLVNEPEITLMHADYQQNFRVEESIFKLIQIFSGLAIALTCVGIFGLASFSALRRQKEVAVRKVLGASRISIMNLLAKEFLILVLVSVAIAYPLTYWLVGDWLANFNERVDQALWVYLVAAVSVAAITWLTVATLAFKAASTRPSLVLRDE